MKVIKTILAPSGIIHCTFIFAHLQRCREKRKERGKKKTEEGKDKESPLMPTYSKEGNDEGRKNYRKTNEIIRNI